MKLFSNDEIDRQKWDDCIKSSPNGLIYARSFYLDNMCPTWKGLRGDNYEWVLPVTWRKKFGISYLYQPAFTQQLGVFAQSGFQIPYEKIIQTLEKNFKFWDINWNYCTDTNHLSQPLKVTAATNFILDLSIGYDRISANYHGYLVKSLKNSQELKLQCNKSDDFQKIIDLYKSYYGGRMPHVTKIDYENFAAICERLNLHQSLICREVTNVQGKLLAAIILLSDGKRLYNIINVITQEGRKAEANRFLFNSVIKEFSGKDVLFDFEGSDLPGVKAFYKSFGAVNQPYCILKHNALPWPLRLFKK